MDKVFGHTKSQGGLISVSENNYVYNSDGFILVHNSVHIFWYDSFFIFMDIQNLKCVVPEPLTPLKVTLRESMAC